MIYTAKQARHLQLLRVMAKEMRAKTITTAIDYKTGDIIVDMWDDERRCVARLSLDLPKDVIARIFREEIERKRPWPPHLSATRSIGAIPLLELELA